MPALFIFLLKVNAALLLFCAGYYLVLRHLTFYTLNRVYLMAAIVFATVYPQINLDAFFQRHQQLAQPVYVVVNNLGLPEQALAQPAYWTWLEIVFFAGVILLTIKLAMQLFSLYKVYRASRREEIMGHDVRVVKGDGGPFSFWKSIYVNPTGYNEEDLRAILKHEQIHTDQWHTIDILLAELSVIFYWFNPGVWLMRKAVRENIEFITDRKILQQGADTKQYQYSLLNVSVLNTKPGIANHFNISTLKKRILMMNAKRSSTINLTRYAFLVPVLLVMLLIFSVSRAAIVKTTKLSYKALATSVTEIVNDNPVTNKLGEIFRDSVKVDLSPKAIDTIKIIRASKKDTFKIIGGNINFEPTYKITIDTDKAVRTLNFTVDTNTRKITRVRINGKDYQLPAGVADVTIPDSALKRIFISHDSSKRIKMAAVNFSYDEKPTDEKTHTVFGGSGFYPMQRDSNATKKIKILMQRLLEPGANNQGKVVNYQGKLNAFANNQPTKKMDIVTITGHPTEASISHMGEKLIIIDGVEATEKDLKKMRVADIEMVVNKGSEELIKQYGDKAKNGVVFITTKKQP